MAKEVPNIAESEWEIMKILWENSPRTANEVVSALQGKADWKPKTIRTLLDRLMKKKVVGVNKEQRVYTFYPLYAEDECQRAEAKSFLKRIYGGTLKSMLVQFIEDDALSEKDMNEIRQMLDKKSK
ncbi:BlaI family transcriptional regulator, penicillinase repressor [Terribacillus aidingensis]|uniref:BlaI family transcriptional regulator, penicillinase repressor n=1 Tax=Terribacillus aidingensis TaxID=586416 RepID=A0A285N7W9_9BACI|nr:penicillinase repressor BlaI [Terribacillus aidingensis]SNZ05510.1 BlaI family transcriptional regulator, penicillinase repressor [Terribacillus aidingensis]